MIKDPINSISVGVTWIDGRIFIKTADKYRKWSKFYYGICHCGGNVITPSPKVFAITPQDYEEPLMITTINVSATERFCSRAFTCLNLSCPFNLFSKEMFLAEFSGSKAMSLGLPKDFGTKPFWFNEGAWGDFWKGMIIPIDGGILRYKEE